MSQPEGPACTFDVRFENPSREDALRVEREFEGRLDARTSAYLNACVRCGLCADTCHYYLTDGEAASVPAAKLHLLASVYAKNHSLAGRFAPTLTGAKHLTSDGVKAWVDGLFGRCTLCGRCAVNCSIGIHLPSLFRAGRGALTASGFLPPELPAPIQAHLATGNSMSITREEWLETVDWLQDELRGEVGDAGARMPIDEHGARFLYTVNPREAKFFPLSLLAAGKIFHAARESWTMSSDLPDLTNYGLFSGDAAPARDIARKLADKMESLGTRTLVIGECGHGFVSNRWEAPEWLGREGFKVISVLELYDAYLDEDRLTLDPARNAQPVTLHDPCNLVRHGGVSEPQRRVLRRCVTELREMSSIREQAFCCGGGGGQLGMGRYATRRLKAGRVKADQIAATGAKVVAAPCHNCIDQLLELNKAYGLGVQIRTVGEILADAIVLHGPPS